MITILQNKIDELTSKVNEMRKVVFANLVDWKQISNILIGETVLIDATFNTKLYEDDNCMVFKTIIPKNVTFPYHLHDYLEQSLVIAGELSDIEKKYKKTDWMIYEPLTGHEIKNLSDKDASLIVIFTK